MMKGLDVSVHNGTIDWKKVRDSGLQFALIRAGYGKELNQKDARFDANMTGALAAGMKTGAYWFSYALNPEEAREEAQVCLQVLAPYTGKMTLPVFYDFEYATEAYAQRYGYTFTKAQRTEIILAFMQEISKVYPAPLAGGLSERTLPFLQCPADHVIRFGAGNYRQCGSGYVV